MDVIFFYLPELIEKFIPQNILFGVHSGDLSSLRPKRKRRRQYFKIMPVKIFENTVLVLLVQTGPLIPTHGRQLGRRGI